MTINDRYRERELRRVVDAGPAPHETWFRLVLSGAEHSRHLNVTTSEARAIIALLAGSPADD